MTRSRPAHRTPLRRTARLARSAAAAAAGGLALALLPATGASADVTRCVGAVETPGAFACYTSPRFDHAGVDRSRTADVPPVCYGLGCTQSQLEIWAPADSFSGRFTAVSYLGHSYTVFRPAAGQPYVLSTTNPRLTPLTELQVLALEAALAAAQG